MKVSIIGAGSVGSQTAFCLATRELCDVALIDIVGDLAKGKALDIQESLPIANSDVSVNGGNDYKLTKNSDIVIVTAGLPRKPGMTREDLISINSKILRSIVPEVVKYSSKCIFIIVTNPLDAMTYLTFKISGFPRNKVIGMAGALDSSRLRAFLKEATGKKVKNIHGLVLGSHGDTMIPIISQSTINDKGVNSFLTVSQINKIIARVRGAGGEIVKYLKTSSTCFAPALALTQMVDAILNDKKTIIPCTVFLNGEFGLKNICIGVPVRLGKNGFQEIIEIKMNNNEKTEFDKSVNKIKKLICLIK